MDDKLRVREDEKKVFLRTFDTYIAEWLWKSESLKCTFKRKSRCDVSVIFEFNEKNGSKTIREFPEDLMFSFEIAVEAMEERAQNSGTWHVTDVTSKSAVVSVTTS